MPGYSGTPLARKLGLKAPVTLAALGAPREYAEWLGDLEPGVRIVTRLPAVPRAVHFFTRERAELSHRLSALRGILEPSGYVWVSWPKKASKVPTDITEDVIRAVALPLGFVDIKVCAVSDVWSGLKLVIRKDQR